MPLSPFTLAAFATSAVPDLQARSVRMHTAFEHEAYTAAVITTADGDVIVRIPNTDAAEVKQSGEILGQSALTDGVRAQLPFLVPATLGMTRAGDSRAVVSTFLPGAKISVTDLTADAALIPEIASMLSAIHQIPISVVQQAGLPIRSAENCRVEVARLVDRAAQTRLLPEVVKERWVSELRNKAQWDFAPAVVHGSLSDDQLIIEDDEVVGVLGFDRFSVGDPAVDFAWLLAAGTQVFDAVLAAYAVLSDTAAQHLSARARLLHELEIAQWLLHGVETHDDEIVKDAISMLDRLVDVYARESAATQSAPAAVVLNESEVSAILDETPEITRMRSDTEAYSGWDEDRVFESDGDFADAAAGSDPESAPDSDPDSAPDSAPDAEDRTSSS